MLSESASCGIVTTSGAIIRKPNMLGALTNRRAALIIAHPGHELRVFNWLVLARPSVFVLTDGSGRSGRSRLHQTTQILNQTGACPGSIYGRFSDREVYSAILQQDIERFVRMAAELSAALQTEQIDYVVSDAVEGYNPAHDICHLIASAAVEHLRKLGRCLKSFEVLLTSRNGHSLVNGQDMISIEVNPEVLSQKLQAAANYSELAFDLAQILQQEGIDALRKESMRGMKPFGVAPDDPPFYETYGQKQVEHGYYQEVIRYREHILPIVEALRNFAEGKVGESTCES